MTKPRTVVAAAVLLVLLGLGALGWQLALQRLKAGIEAALGPRATVGRLELGWSGVQIHALRIRSQRGAWPADDELRAARVRLQPALSSLWSAGWRIHRIEIDEAYVSLQRTAEGRLRVLPALLEQAGPPGARGTPAPRGPRVRIEHVALKSAAVDFYDASVRQPAHRMRFEALQAGVGPLDWPALDTSAQMALQARFKGPQRDGSLRIDGTLTPASLDADLKVQVRGVDLLALQPYLLRVNEGGVKSGTLDLSLDARVEGRRLHAPGTLVLTGLDLSSGGGLLGTFAGVPRQAVVAAMAREGRIDVGFTLEGRLDDPAFSLNANLATRLASGLAQALGVSLVGVVEGVGNVIKGLLGR